MATFRRFEEIDAWQKSRRLASEVYRASAARGFDRDIDLRRQLRRAAVSIMSNIAEGFERGGTAEFIHFLSIAKGSAGEIAAQLYVAVDQGYIPEQAMTHLKSSQEEVSRMIGGLMNYLRESAHRGNKFQRSKKPAVPTRNSKPETRNSNP